MTPLRRFAVVVICSTLLSPFVFTAASSSAVGGVRVAIRMPYLNGGNTGFESLSTHHHFFTSGFAWDLLKDLNQAVYARAASSDGNVSIHTGSIGSNGGGAGQWVQVTFRVNGTDVGTVWFNHLQNLQVVANTDYSNGQLLGYTGAGTFQDTVHCGPPFGGIANGYRYSTSWQVCTPTGVHTHTDVANGCWRSLGTKHSWIQAPPS